MCSLSLLVPGRSVRGSVAAAGMAAVFSGSLAIPCSLYTGLQAIAGHSQFLGQACCHMANTAGCPTRPSFRAVSPGLFTSLSQARCARHTKPALGHCLAVCDRPAADRGRVALSARRLPSNARVLITASGLQSLRYAVARLPCIERHHPSPVIGATLCWFTSPDGL